VRAAARLRQLGDFRGVAEGSDEALEVASAVTTPAPCSGAETQLGKGGLLAFALGEWGA